jgi:hypothetical protein
MIVFKTAARDSIILGTNGEDCIIAALDLLVDRGNEDEVKEAIHLLELLGKNPAKRIRKGVK